MQALVWQGPRQLVLEDVPSPHPGAGEVALAVAAVAICGSELEGYLGLMSNRTPPLVMGHEFAGTVLGGPHDGRLCAVNPLISCGACRACRGGRQNLCPQRSIIGIGRPGAFAEQVVVPEANLIPLPDGMPAVAGALVEPLANVVHAIELGWRDGIPQSVLVLGAGSLGLLAVQTARLSGASTVVAMDLQAERLAVAAAAGASATLVSTAPDAADTLDQLAPEGFDVVIDCVGAAPTKQLAVARVRSGGRVVLLGLHDDAAPLSSHELIRREITLTGSYTYTDVDLRRSLALLASGAVDYASWSQVRPLAGGPESFAELVDSPSAIAKIVLTPGGTHA